MLPVLQREFRDGIAFWTDTSLDEYEGVFVGFSERSGGVSEPPYATLNLAGHVGDRPEHVDENRARLLAACDLGHTRERLTTAEQVHGTAITVVDAATAGQGAFASHGAAPVAATDSLVTTQADTPLLLCFADCVPVILVAPGPAVAVVHAGWRGALGGILGLAARALADLAESAPVHMRAYVGPHIGSCHYDVDDEILSQFVNTFGTLARAGSGGLDLGFVVAASLTLAGVDPCNIARLGTCTAETTDRFFSHRAESGLTGRHGALVCIRS